MITLLDDTIPRGSDPAPGTKGNKCAKQEREVRSKINEIISWINNGGKHDNQ